jgi:hypothetical protein
MSSVQRRDDDSAPLEVARLEMRSGEKLLWAGQPGAFALARAEAPKALFGIPFLAFALFWTYMAGARTWFSTDAESRAIAFFPLFGFIFIAVGLAMVLSPVWAAIRARWIVYAISDRRLVIMTLFPLRRVRSFASPDIQELERSDRAGGSGDIVFRRDYSSSRRGRSNLARRIGFFGVPDVRMVEDTIRRMREA